RLHWCLCQRSALPTDIFSARQRGISAIAPIQIIHVFIRHVIACDWVTLQRGVHSPFVLGSIRTLDRERVFETEVVKNVLPALFEFVHQVGIIQDSQTWMRYGVARKLVPTG